MKISKRGIVPAAGLVLTLGALSAPAVTATSDEAVTDVVPVSHGGDDADVTRGDFLQVYSVNWENLPEANWEDPRLGHECAGDWRDLRHYMKVGPGPEHGGPFPTYTPDLLLVQQVDGPRELDRLVKEMTEKLDGRYAGVIANQKDHDEVVNRWCRTETGNTEWKLEKDEQTNAVIYRTGRFELVDSWGWQSQAGDGCENGHQDRTRNVAVRLRDKIYGASDRSYHVTAASVHWPTNTSDGKGCRPANWREVVEKMNEPKDDELRIIGGDFNARPAEDCDASSCWYRNANGELPVEDEYEANDYRDVIFDHCNESGPYQPACLEQNWTFNHAGPGDTRRIDFIFAQADGGRGSIALPEVHAAHTVTFNEGDSADNHATGDDREDLSYSEHRAIRARIHYPF